MRRSRQRQLQCLSEPELEPLVLLLELLELMVLRAVQCGPWRAGLLAAALAPLLQHDAGAGCSRLNLSVTAARHPAPSTGRDVRYPQSAPLAALAPRFPVRRTSYATSCPAVPWLSLSPSPLVAGWSAE